MSMEQLSHQRILVCSYFTKLQTVQPTRQLTHQRSLFFFKAKDGIRDYKVTGVQTCALPIYISQANQIQGTNTFSVPGYTGTVTGIQPGLYYTLQQLEQAGLQSGQPDAQFHPGSWTTTQSA